MLSLQKAFRNIETNEISTLPQMRAAYKADYLPTIEEGDEPLTLRAWLREIVESGDFEEVTTYEEAQKALVECHKASDSPKQTAEAIVERIGYEDAQSLLALMVSLSAWDGRISKANADWAEPLARCTKEEAEAVYFFVTSDIHMAHLDQIVNAFRSIPNPIDEEIAEAVAEEIEAEEEAEGFTIERDNEEDETAATAEEAAQIVADWLSDSEEGEEAYRDMIDEVYPMVEIMGMTYYPSVALERLDPVAYRCGLVDWADSIYSDIVYELEHCGEWSGYCFTIKAASI